MSGLILAGLGRGISDAATTFGTSMMRQNEEAARAAREEARDMRKVDRDRQAAEDKKQQVIAEIAAAREGGDQISRDRIAGQVLAQGGANIAGDSPVMEQSELAQLIKDNPQFEQTYRQSGLIQDAMDPRLQRATDQYDAALAAGASSTTLEGLEKTKQTALATIRDENKQKADDRRFDIMEQRNIQQQQQFMAGLGVRQQQADTAASRATGAGAPNQAAIGGAESALNNAIRRVGDAWDASNPETMQDKVDPAAQAARAARRDRAVNGSPEVARARERLDNLYSGASAPPSTGPRNPGDNTATNRPPLSSFARPQ